MREIELDTAVRLLEQGQFNFLRRTAELALHMSGGRWRLATRTPEALTFRAVAPSGDLLPDEMVLPLASIARITWDRLPKQQHRSQVRFHFPTEELWTFSGTVDESLLD